MLGVFVPACLWAWILTLTDCKIPDSHVTCVFSEDCVLPCRFKPAGDAIVSWYRQNSPVYSSSTNSDRLEPQALFTEKVADGNASLHLRASHPQNRGRYRCQVHNDLGEQKSFVVVRVEAPIKSLALEMTHDSGFEIVKCWSQDVYPAPQLGWSTDPPLQPDALKPTTRKTADEQGLYSVESKLDRLGDNYTYFCNLNSSYGTQTWTASLKETEIMAVEGADLMVPCVAPRSLQNFTLTWTFTKVDEPTEILTFNSRNRHTSNHWGSRAQLDLDRVLAGDGSLRLQNLEGLAHAGAYICIFSAFQTRYLVRTSVNFSTGTGDRQQEEDMRSWLWIIAGATAGLALLVTVLAVTLKLKGHHCQASNTSGEITEMQPIRTDNAKAERGTLSESCHLSTDQFNGFT